MPLLRCILAVAIACLSGPTARGEALELPFPGRSLLAPGPGLVIVVGEAASLVVDERTASRTIVPLSVSAATRTGDGLALLDGESGRVLIEADGTWHGVGARWAGGSGHRGGLRRAGLGSL